MGTEGLSISHSMPHAGTPAGLPCRRQVFSCWCKQTSGLRVPRLGSHYSTFFAMPYPAIMCPDPSYLPNWLLGWEMNMGNIVHTHTHIYPVGIYDTTCRGISEIGT